MTDWPERTNTIQHWETPTTSFLQFACYYQHHNLPNWRSVKQVWSRLVGFTGHVCSYGLANGILIDYWLEDETCLPSRQHIHIRRRPCSFVTTTQLAHELSLVQRQTEPNELILHLRTHFVTSNLLYIRYSQQKIA